MRVEEEEENGLEAEDEGDRVEEGDMRRTGRGLRRRMEEDGGVGEGSREKGKDGERWENDER